MSPPDPAPRRPSFPSPAVERAFSAAYDAVLELWPVPFESMDVPSEFGTTHVHVCGPTDAPPLVLLHGGGATSTVWFANVADLGRAHRVYAVDQIGDAGRSVHEGRPLRRPDDLMTWLDGLLDGLGVRRTALLGHSYGGWLALRYALHAPDRVGALVLLDATDCYVGMSAGYRLRALPLLLRPSARRMRDFLTWETGGALLEPRWLELIGLAGGEVRGSRTVLPRRPSDEQLRASRVPVLQVLAGRSRSTDTARVEAAARRLRPDVVTEVVPQATHHTLPTLDAERVDDLVLRFLART